MSDITKLAEKIAEEIFPGNPTVQHFAVLQIVDALRDSDPQDLADAELARWQNAIRECVIKESGAPDEMIDGSPCDSGDALDLTLAEVRLGFGFLKDSCDAVKALKSLGTSDGQIEGLIGVCPRCHREVADDSPEGVTVSVCQICEEPLGDAGVHGDCLAEVQAAVRDTALVRVITDIPGGTSNRGGAMTDITKLAEDNPMLCACCRAGSHRHHWNSGGRCAEDNKFNSDCRCEFRPKQIQPVLLRTPLPQNETEKSSPDGVTGTPEPSSIEERVREIAEHAVWQFEGLFGLKLRERGKKEAADAIVNEVAPLIREMEQEIAHKEAAYQCWTQAVERIEKLKDENHILRGHFQRCQEMHKDGRR